MRSCPYLVKWRRNWIPDPKSLTLSRVTAFVLERHLLKLIPGKMQWTTTGSNGSKDILVWGTCLQEFLRLRSRFTCSSYNTTHSTSQTLWSLRTLPSHCSSHPTGRIGNGNEVLRWRFRSCITSTVASHISESRDFLQINQSTTKMDLMSSTHQILDRCNIFSIGDCGKECLDLIAEEEDPKAIRVTALQMSFTNQPIALFSRAAC